MLGWQIYIKQENEALIASWCVGLGGLDWLDHLVNRGFAQNLGGNGYPCRYSANAEIIFQKILPYPPINEGAKLTLGEDYVIDTKEIWQVKINHDAVKGCKPFEKLTIEVWDLS